MSRFLRAWAVCALAALGALAPGAAQAHAVLVRSSPEADARLVRAPSALRLEFNEPVSVIALRVLDGSGVDLAGAPRVDGGSVRVPIAMPPSAIQPEGRGRYIVSYRVLSADSHPVSASFEFTVGAAPVLPPAAVPVASLAAREGPPPALWTAVALRALQLAMLAIVVGATLYGLVVGGTPAKGGGLVVASGVGMAAALLSIGPEGALALGQGVAALFEAQAWQLGLASTRGTAALAGAAGFACMGLAAAGGSARVQGVLNSFGIAASLSAFVLSGHGATAEPPGLAQGLWLLHVLCALGWVGSLQSLIAALGRDAAAARLARRFSARALVAVPLLLGAGLVMAATEGGSAMFRGRFLSAYFEVLGVKLCLVALMLALALWNRLALLPRFEAGEAGAGRLLAWSIRAELLLGFGVLAAAALLSHQIPPRSLEAAPLRAEATAEAPVLELTAAGGSVRLRLRTAPDGEALHLDLTDAAGRPLRAKSLGLELASTGAGIESLPRELVPEGEAGWRLSAQSVPRAGPWRVEIDALLSDFERQAFHVLLDKDADGRLGLRRADAPPRDAGPAGAQSRSSR